jgi:hypothetical protein
MARSRTRWLRLVLAAIAISALMPSFPVVKAQDLVVNDWSSDDNGTFGLDWVNFRSYAYGVNYTFDPTQNSVGNTNNGSMYVTVQWPTNSDPNWNESWNDIQFAFYTPPFDPTNYINFDVDIKVDVTNSSPAVDGASYGAVELIVNNPWTTVLGYQTLALTNGWQHISGSLSSLPNEVNSEAVIGFISNGGDSLTNTVSYWIGNITFTAPPTVFTNQPVLSLTRAPAPGLTCVTTKALDTYQRQMISTVNSNYSWNTANAISNTTVYSMTIASFPRTNYAGFNSQMFLVPQNGGVFTPFDDNVDWDSTNVAALYVGENAGQPATATFQYKINNPSSWNTALVVTKSSATGPLGKWSLSFNNNTNVTLTAPDDTSTNFTIPAGDAAYFAGPLYVYVGTQPNNNANIGQSSTFGNVTISGAAGSINDNFASLDTNWNTYAADPGGIFITPQDTLYSIAWPQPDYGFTNVYATDNLTTNPQISQWLTLPPSATGWINVANTQRLTLIRQSTLNAAFGYSPTNCFFGLYQP